MADRRRADWWADWWADCRADCWTDCWTDCRREYDNAAFIDFWRQAMTAVSSVSDGRVRREIAWAMWATWTASRERDADCEAETRQCPSAWPVHGQCMARAWQSSWQGEREWLWAAATSTSFHIHLPHPPHPPFPSGSDSDI